jgi:hypothetical protein
VLPPTVATIIIIITVAAQTEAHNTAAAAAVLMSWMHLASVTWWFRSTASAWKLPRNPVSERALFSRWLVAL